MKNVLYFSDFIKPLAQRLKFISIIAGRFFKILFRRKKDIDLLQLSYTRKNQFENSYLIIRYSFKNALWYNFRNIKQTTEKKIIVVNLKLVSETPIELIVYGFFRKKVMFISVIVENILQSKSFVTNLTGMGKVKCYAKPHLLDRPVTLSNPKCAACVPKVNLKYPHIQIRHTSFSQIDFI